MTLCGELQKNIHSSLDPEEGKDSLESLIKAPWYAI